MAAPRSEKLVSRNEADVPAVSSAPSTSSFSMATCRLRVHVYNYFAFVYIRMHREAE